MQDVTALKGKSLAELREMAKSLGIAEVMVKKSELLGKIAAATPSAPETAQDTDPQEEKPAERKRGRRPRTVSYTHLTLPTNSRV